MPPYKKPLSSIRLPSICNISKSNHLMGCASSQAAEIKAQQQKSGNEPTDDPNKVDVEEKKQNDETGNINESDENNKENLGTTKYPPAEAFEIPLDNLMGSPTDDAITSGESIIKKHPPKRLQRLVEQSQQQETSAAATTIEDLEEKLAKAEIRRQKILKQRVDTSLSLAQPLPTTPRPVKIEENINDDNDLYDEVIVTVKNNDEINVIKIVNDHSDDTNYTTNITTSDYNKDVIDENMEHNNSNSNNNSNNGINHSTSLRNYTRAPTPTVTTKKIIINDTVNKKEKYRSPGDGDESKENVQM